MRTFREPIFYRIREVPAEPESIRRTRKDISPLAIFTAIQCQKLGYKRLAAEIYRRWKLEWKEPPCEHLWAEADSYWTAQISNPQCDRKIIIRQFKNLHRVYPFDGNLGIIRSLELANAPRKQKNDPFERLIDELVNTSNTINEDEFEAFHECPPIRKLIEKGFDAIPALISHLEDNRMTRCAFPIGYRGSIFPRAGVTVGEVCVHLLQEIAGKRFHRVELTAKEKADQEKLPRFPLGINMIDSGKPLQQKPIDDWRKQTQKKSEKEYLESHLFALETNLGFGAVVHVPPANPTILTMLSARFPEALKESYRNGLSSRPRKDTSRLAMAVVNSSLDRKVKREILDLGLKHQDLQHRMDAEAALSVLDNEEYSKRLITFIDRMPLPEGDPDKVREEKVLESVKRSRDSAVWSALEKAIHRSPRWLCFQLLSDLNVFALQGDQSRRESIRILAAFLDDAAVQTDEDIKKDNPNGYASAHDRYELRNFVAYQLAPYFAEYIEYDEHRSGDEWACLRKWLKDEVEKELK